MYYLKAKASFDAAHFLYGYDGKCHNIHGHHWMLELRICGDSLQQTGQERGMLVDFSQLKNDLKIVAEQLDHTLIYESGTLKPLTIQALQEENFSLTEIPFRPTAENLAKYFYDRMTALHYRVAESTVYETPNNCASYCAED